MFVSRLFIPEQNASVAGKFHSIADKVVQNLCHSAPVGIQKKIGQGCHRTYSDLLVRLLHSGSLFYFQQHTIDIYVHIDILQRTCFHLRQIQNITDELQQYGIVVLDNTQIFYSFLFGNIRSQ